MIFKRGDKAPVVSEIKCLLAEQGFWPGIERGPFFTLGLVDAVAYFQQTHLGRNGKFLVVDGIVGPETWWALQHPAGWPQCSGLESNHFIPRGIGGVRQLILGEALSQHNVREEPNGSNRGPEVDKYLPEAWLKKVGKGPAWCCFFVSWVLRRANQYPFRQYHGSCSEMFNAAKKAELTMGRDGRILPGDVFYMRWGPGTGHTGFVYTIAADKKEMTTIEGNCGNRVKIGHRLIDDKMHGFINFCGDYGLSIDAPVIIKAEDVSKDSTR